VHIEFKTVRRDIVDYAVVLLVDVDGGLKTVRLYDGAHNENELHRYTRGRGKQPAEIAHCGTLGQGMRAAIEEIEQWSRHGTSNERSQGQVSRRQGDERSDWAGD
jgi:hypothetical protein